MNDDSRRNLEVNLPRALCERVRALGYERGRSTASLIEESLEAYLCERSERPGALVRFCAATRGALHHA